jgi:hypothetical protein
VRRFTCGTRRGSVDPYQRRIPMNSSVECKKLTLLKALLTGYIFRVSDILSKKSGYLGHLDEIFLRFGISLIRFV